MRSTVLAIETSQRQASVALMPAPHQPVDVEPLRKGARHEDDLMPAIDRLCRRCSVSPGDLAAVGVSVGPGAFTGLRIAVSTAKMLAEALDVKLIAAPSALVVAESVDARGAIVICLASKRNTTWMTRCERASGRWSVVGSPGIVTAPEIDLTGVERVLADDYLPSEIRTMIERAGITIEAPTFDAGHCLAVVNRMLDAGETIDNGALAPIYARPPEAVRLWQKHKTPS